MTGDRIDKMDYIHEEEKVGGVRKTELSVKSTAAWRRVGREKRRNQKNISYNMLVTSKSATLRDKSMEAKW